MPCKVTNLVLFRLMLADLEQEDIAAVMAVSSLFLLTLADLELEGIAALMAIFTVFTLADFEFGMEDADLGVKTLLLLVFTDYLHSVQVGASGPGGWYENTAAPRAWRAEPAGRQPHPCCQVQPPTG